MKIMVIGATGTLGKAICENMQQRHELIKVGKNSGDFQADITSESSIKQLFEYSGKVDAIISVTGNLYFGPLADMTTNDFNMGLQDKLLGQVRLALIGQHYLNENGSITLSSGIVSEEPILGGVNATTVNAAIEGFVIAAAVELKQNQRINAICPSVVTESVDVYGPFFPGYETVPAARVALAFQRSVEGIHTGKTLNVW